jgi:hypothetical protein
MSIMAKGERSNNNVTTDQKGLQTSKCTICAFVLVHFCTFASAQHGRYLTLNTGNPMFLGVTHAAPHLTRINTHFSISPGHIGGASLF